MRAWLLLLAVVVACDGGTTSDVAFRRGDETDEPAAGFVPELDVGDGVASKCNPGTQNCPVGEKCMWYANDGGPAWNATRCVPVDPGAVEVGQACAVEGNAVSGIDDCPRGSMCRNVDAKGAGMCESLCVGTWGTQCLDPDELCVQGAEGLGLCYRACDPVDPNACPPGQGCYASYGGLVCVPDASGRDGAQGDPCEFVNACDPGLLCTGAASLDGCTGASGCCTAACDLDAPSCPDGLTCTPLYDGTEPEVPPGFEHVGVCTSP